MTINPSGFIYITLVVSVLLYAADTQTLLSAEVRTLEPNSLNILRQSYHYLIIIIIMQRLTRRMSVTR